MANSYQKPVHNISRHVVNIRDQVIFAVVRVLAKPGVTSKQLKYMVDRTYAEALMKDTAIDNKPACKAPIAMLMQMSRSAVTKLISEGPISDFQTQTNLPSEVIGRWNSRFKVHPR